jgi:hypothetical protein
MIINANKRAVMQKIIDESNIDALLAIVTKMDDETRAEVLKAIASQLDITKKNFHVAKIRRIVAASDTEIKDWIVTAVADSYASGSNVMYADLRKMSADPISGEIATAVWTADKIRNMRLLSVQKDAVNALISDTYLDFANGMNGLVRGAEHIINDAMKRQTRAQMIAGQITGQSMRDIAKEVRTIFESQGFSVLIDRGGNSWTLKRYSEMLARTHIMKSANEGVIARLLAYGVDIVQISTHPGACPICQPHEGKIFSLSGKSEKYEKLSEQPPYHPHCRHTLLPRPDLAREEGG